MKFYKKNNPQYRNLQKTSPKNKQIIINTSPKTSNPQVFKKNAYPHKNKPKFAGKPQGWQHWGTALKEVSVFQIEMTRATNSPVFGPSAKVLKQSASNFFTNDVIPGRYGPLQSARQKFLFFAKFHYLTTNIFAAVLSILPFCQRSVSLVSTQISEPC